MMIHHPELHLLVLTPEKNLEGSLWQRLNEDIPHLTVHLNPSNPYELTNYHSVVTVGPAIHQVDTEALLNYVASGGGWLVINNLQEIPLPDEFGVQPGPVGPETELRILFQDTRNPLGARLADSVYVQGSFHPLEIVAKKVEVLLCTDWRLSQKPVWTTIPYGSGYLGCTTLQDFSSTMLFQLTYRLLRKWQGRSPEPEAKLGIGMLGYAPSVGLIHGLAVGNVPGLELRSVCDLSRPRLEQARLDFPEVTLHDRGKALAEDPEVDLVIIATPPNLHANHCVEMMRAGKHVLCEKPLALSRQETEKMIKVASEHQVHLSCHQNRRFDTDYLCIKNCVDSGRIGDIFHLESFVGGFRHPCPHWHSDAKVSGGTSFDWGAHHLDWIVSLMPFPVEAVMGSRHKRVWHDVTNGDQERVLIRFAGGREAEFIHSDIAAARKPKWYLLGTRGAIVGDWQDISAYHADPNYYFEETAIPATEMMPDITLFRRLTSDAIEEEKPALPERNPFSFHANLADHLLWGEPLAAPLADSVKVVVILEAAARSMAENSRWVEIAHE